ncbi:MAG: hypothetical protein GY822_11480 [Deltaproteobacteria bacterium]|nr:hypothetical protein [Deltaproteobacteria bacterium]
MTDFLTLLGRIFAFSLLLTTGGSAYSQEEVDAKDESVGSDAASVDNDETDVRNKDDGAKENQGEEEFDDIDEVDIDEIDIDEIDIDEVENDEANRENSTDIGAEELSDDAGLSGEKELSDDEKAKMIAAVQKQKEIDELAEEPGKVILDDGIERLRRPVDRLVEQTLGSTSRPVGFDWRDTWAQFGITGSELLERNNFGSFRIGAMTRKPFGDVMVEIAANYVYVFGTESSRLLALTPYIQPGRPSRIEFDVNVSYPIIEGVVTPFFNFFPPMEMVFSGTAGARYLLYPKAVMGTRDWKKIDTWTNTSTWREVGLTLATPQLTEEDRVSMEREVLGGMMLDPARIQTLVGFSFDVYMQPGFFVSTKALLAVPALLTVSGTRLGFWPELSVALGYAF